MNQPPSPAAVPIPPRRSVASRLGRVALWIAAAAVLIAILGFFVAPPLVKSKAEGLLSERLHRKVTLGEVRINPFTLSAVVEGFAVRERDSEDVAVSFDSLAVNVSSTSLFRLAPVIQAVRLVGPYVHVVRRADGTYNFQDLIDEVAARPPSDAPPPKFSVNNIEVVDGRIAFDDRPKQARHEVTDIRVGIPFVSNLPAAVDINVQPALAAKVNGSPLELKGETKPFKDTHETTLNVDLDDLQLPKYVEYSPIALPFRVPSGSLDTRLRLVFKTTADDRPVQMLVTGEAGLRKLVIQDRAGAPAVAVPALDVSVDPVDLVENRARVKFLRVDGLEVHGTRRKDGTINLLELVPGVESRAPAAAPSKPFAFAVDEISLKNGKFHLEDRTPDTPFTVFFDAVTADVRDLSNAPGSKAAVKASYVTDAKASFSYDGTAGINPVTAEGRFALGGWQLAVLYPYYADALNVEVVDGKADAEGQVFVAVPAGGGDPVIKASGVNAALKSVKLRYPGEKRLFADIPIATVTDAAADIGRRSIEIARVATQDGAVWIRRLADGEIQLTRIVKTRADVAAAGQSDKDVQVWTYGASVMEVQNFTIDYDDETVKPTARAELRRLAARLENFSNAKGARFALQANGVVNKAGTFSVAGPVGINPVGGRVRIDAKGLAIPFVQPFIDDQVNLAITSGALSARGELTFDLPTGGAPKGLWIGDVGIADFASIDKPTSSDLLKWKSLYLTRVRAQLAPLQASVDEVALSEFYARLILNADGTFNIQNLLSRPKDAGGDGSLRADGTRAGAAPKPAAEAAGAAPIAAEATESGRIGAGAEPSGRTRTATVPATGRGMPADVRVGRITLQGGNVNFSDFFIKPNYSANLTGIGGSVGELTGDKAGDVELRGKVDNTAPVEITGRVNPLAADLFLDIKASARDIELPPLSPYAIKYAGYGIEKGKLSMNVKYLIENRKLAAENNIYLDQLTFGEKVESPTATKLPVLLAVSLLKDRNGVIDINLPISGSLDDPQFSIGGIVVQVIVNLLTKIVTAPFAALASAFGGKEELAYVEFAPGSAKLDGDARKRLDTLAKALNDRPQLKLDISGRADPAADREGLKAAYVESKVKAQKVKRLAREGKAPASADDVTVSGDEYPALLKAAYGEETFPKPRNVIGFAKDLPVPEMENLMITNAAVTEEDLRQLAGRRAQAAKDYLVETGKVPADRVFLTGARVGGDAPKDGKGTRADFSLK